MKLLECLKNVYIKMDENLMMYSVRAHLQGEYEDMKDCYKTLLTYIKVGFIFLPFPSPPFPSPPPLPPISIMTGGEGWR